MDITDSTPHHSTVGWGPSTGLAILNGPDPRITQFAKMFRGRWDAVGGDDGRAIYEPYTYGQVEAHLLGVDPFGVYTSWPDQNGDRWCVWGTGDIDTGDWDEAFQLATALKGMGLVPHVERSRSKGWHVWLFVQDPIPAWVMRRCFKVAYAAIGLDAKEINPKSEVLLPAQLGNYVRLPYKGGLILGSGRQCMMREWTPANDGQPCPFKDWMYYISRTTPFSDPAQVAHWASKWFERPRRTSDVAVGDPAKVQHLTARLSANWVRRWNEGDVTDRSSAFMALAYWCAEHGWSAQDTFDVLWWCPWNKYFDRASGDSYVKDIVERAYN